MNINLTDSTVQRLQVWMANTRAATADDVINKALDCFEEHNGPSPAPVEADAEAIVNRFRKYRGMLSGVTIDDIVSWRRRGLP
jgi:hypothetical protein